MTHPRDDREVDVERSCWVFSMVTSDPVDTQISPLKTIYLFRKMIDSLHV